MPPTRILVIGAGELGLAILEAFAAHPSKPVLSVLLREGSPSAAAVAHLGVTPVFADLAASVSDLAAVFAAFDIVLSAAGFGAGPGTQLRLAHAALQARVRRFVPWQFGVDYDAIGRGAPQPLFDEQLDVRALLRAQADVPWTVVSTGLFTSFLFAPAFGVVERAGTGRAVAVHALGSWDNALTLTAAEDIARITAALLLDGAPPDGVVHVAGDTRTFADVARVLEARGWAVSRPLRSVPALEADLARDPANGGLRYQLVWARGVGVSWAVAESWNGRRGIAGQTLEEWVDRNFVPPSSDE
jgi:hypothetical protein